ncbi:alpha/beta fold hydrolase [Pedobacter duraquae]|uniref:Pimeloyl-ACP methyl ester carboxylesterase n=1 Tax=Pedobacter duraquae TaxID=425511 RepID=A0A4R6IDD8_9SPHI|nr:alpha/beta hydrolase [Pedobacter duraquae]TDO20290.1 pimeloyl-ACP methyl ester carboxylesterase [Pedobacter duraquae]
MKTTEINDVFYVRYKKVAIGSIEIFYREAGDPKKPSILLLHGFPSSSHMFRNLIEQLSSDYFLIAPDYPGFGYSSCPDPAGFDYSFDHLADIMEQFIDTLKLHDITFYMQDYGGPVGFRIITKRPELVSSIIIQNANVFLEGLGPHVQKIAALTDAQDFAGLDAAIEHMMTLDGIKEQYVSGTLHPDRISPDSYYMDHLFFEEPGKKAIQKILFANYGSNFPKYPQWQSYLREHQPPMLITWGKNDNIFPGSGALAYKKELPDAEVHLFDGGHFLLEEYGIQVAQLIRSFLNRQDMLYSK